jgi:hypothetical protein
MTKMSYYPGLSGRPRIRSIFSPIYPHGRGISGGFSVSFGLEVRAGVDGPARVVVALQSALEGAGADGAGALLLAMSTVSSAHQVVTLIGCGLLAAPNSPGYQGQTGKDNGSTNADGDSDDRVAGLRAHATR